MVTEKSCNLLNKEWTEHESQTSSVSLDELYLFFFVAEFKSDVSFQIISLIIFKANKNYFSKEIVRE